MKYIVEDEEMGPYFCETKGNGTECIIEYMKLINDGNGYKLYINGEHRCDINFAEMWYMLASLRIMESEYQMLSDMNIYKLGDKL